MNPYGAGWHLDRARFDETLREACGPVLRKGSFVAVRRVEKGDEDNHVWELEAEMKGTGAVETFRARWIVDATGRKASVARKVRHPLSSPRIPLTRIASAWRKSEQARRPPLLLRTLPPD